jgi:uncharacterized protein YdeI (BOF family)
MRKTFFLTLILLVTAFAVAQQQAAPQGPPAATSPDQTQSQPATTPDQAATPSAPAAAGDVIEGCLGGSNPNFTVTDKSGTAYQLKIPEGADVSVLGQHIGEPVQVQGSVDNTTANSGAQPGSVSGSESRSDASAHSIKVSHIRRGTGTCPAGASKEKQQPK